MNPEIVNPEIVSDSLAIYLRWVLLVGVILTFAVFLIETVLAVRRISRGQRLFSLALLAANVYIIGATHAAIDAGLLWNWRMIPVAVFVLAMGAYLMEPLRLKEKRFGRPDILSGPAEDEESGDA